MTEREYPELKDAWTYELNRNPAIVDLISIERINPATARLFYELGYASGSAREIASRLENKLFACGSE